jgi:alpha-amylase
MMQAFEWYVAPDGKHFRRLARDIPAYEEIGITALWIPPGCKASGPEDNGYGIYGVLKLYITLMLDLWDLGEFDQKDTTRTKWGSYEELKDLSNKAQEKNIHLYFDAVLNHKAAADETEKCRAIVCDWDGTLLTRQS